LESGRAIVFKGDKSGVIDNDGTVLIPIGQERYVNFGFRYVFFKENEEIEYIDPPAKVFKSVQADADAKARSVLNGYYMVAQGKKCGFLNAKGDTIIPVLYELGAIHPKGYISASLKHGACCVFRAEKLLYPSANTIILKSATQKKIGLL
jgi:hypothetical protein